ncbi:MAG: hypothetical protein ACK5UX_07620 [Burkholderiales bacterium]|jgi:hypothetical protein|nr:DUF3108 domain-containing protein [Nitrosomonadaceae bacterium]
MKHRTVRGRLVYTSKKPERLNQVRGDERFTFTHHTDGKIVLRAFCEIEEPLPTVMRDVVYALNEHRLPMDCSVRIVVGDEFNGSGWFRFSPDLIECESYGPSIGRLSQRVPLAQPIDGFGTHPVVADAFLLGGMDWSTTKRRTLNMYLPSPDLRGATPPMAAPVKIDAEYVGEETVTVKAGTFKTKHFRYLDVGDSGFSTQHPPYDVWVTDDRDAVMVQGGVGGSMMTWYELVELER